MSEVQAEQWLGLLREIADSLNEIRYALEAIGTEVNKL